MPSVFRASGLSLFLWASLAGLAQGQPSDPACEAHFTRQNDPGVELIFPCAEARPPAGLYHVWRQGEWRMTPFSLLVGSSGLQPVEPGVLSSLPTVEAGRVTLPSNLEADPRLDLHLLHAGRYLDQDHPRWEISPRTPSREIGDGVLLPVGKAVGALWDRKSRKYVALSAPFEVRGREAVEVPLQRPQGVAFLVAQVERHAAAATASDLDVELFLRHGGEERAPDLKVLTAERVYGIWYGLAPGTAGLRVRSKQTFFDSPPLDLRSGGIEQVTGELRPRPALQVELDLPSPLTHEELTLQVRRLPMGEIVAAQVLKPRVPSHRFEGLPPALLEVDLLTSFGTFTRQVDLGSGADGFLLLEPELVTVRGTVYHGDQGHPAELAFTTVAQATVKTRTDENGAYEIALVNPLRAVAVYLQGVESAPYLDFFAPAITESKELDFHLPDVEFTVRVLNAVTGEGVPGASVSVRNTYQAEDDDFEIGSREKPRQEERVVSQIATTDKKGVARLPPLRQGDLEIRAFAKGYSNLPEPVQAQVLDGETDQSFEVRLEPAGETVALRLRLPDGTPAAGAEVLLTGSLFEGFNAALFSGRANGEGIVETPRKAGFLLAKHSAAGFLVRPWQPQEGDLDMEWALPLAAGRPLTIQVKDSSGKSAGAQAELALRVEGRRLFGPILAWLTGTHAATDSNGYWVGRNLPQGPVEILAWGARVQEEAWAGRLDAQATPVPFPWPDLVEVRAVE